MKPQAMTLQEFNNRKGASQGASQGAPIQTSPQTSTQTSTQTPPQSMSLDAFNQAQQKKPNTLNAFSPNYTAQPNTNVNTLQAFKNTPTSDFSIPTPPKRDSFLVGAAKDILRPFARAGTTAAEAGYGIKSLFTGVGGADTKQAQQIQSQGLNVPFLGQVKPLAGLKGAAGVGIQAASNFIPAGVGSKVIGNTLKQGLVSAGIKSGAIGGISGLLYGAGKESQNPNATPSSVGLKGLESGVLGGLTGIPLGVGGSLIGKGLALRAFTKNPQKVLRGDLQKFIDSKISLKRIVAKFQTQKNTDVLDVLSQPDVFKGLVPENGGLNVSESVSTIQNNTNKLMSSAGKFIKEISQFAQPIKTSDIASSAIKGLEGTPRQVAKLADQIRAEVSYLPESLSITQADAFRAQAYKSARNAFGIQKSSSEFKALENAARNAVFAEAEKVAKRFAPELSNVFPVLRNEIKNNINTLDFLGGKFSAQRIGGGALTKLSNRAIGAAIGAHGGPLSALAGSEVGGFITRVLGNNNLGGAAKMRLISNVEKDPAVLQQIQKIIGNVKDFNPGDVLGLPSPAMRLPAYKPLQEGARVIPAAKGLVGKHPQTGKFFGTFKSTGK